MPLSSLTRLQPKAVAVLQLSLQHERVAHAYLFQGPKGVGKAQVALAFAQALNCEVNGLDGCGECRSCTKIQKSDNPQETVHPDILHLVCEAEDAETRKTSQFIKVEQVRELLKQFDRSPWEAKRRVVMIHEADRMNAAAQNALLKTLEEPSQRIRTLFILMTHRPQSLLQTIHSRSQVVSFHAVDTRVMVEMLVKEHGIVLEKARMAAALSEGSPKTALDLCEDESVWQEREDSLDGWAHVSAKRPEDVQNLVQLVAKDRERFKRFLRSMMSWHRDLMMIHMGQQALVINQDRLTQLQEEAQRISLRDISERYNRLVELAAAQQINAKADLGLEALAARVD